MFQTLSTSEAADILKADANAAWSYAGAHALVEWLEEVEEGGEPIEFDAVAIRCDFSEYASALEAVANSGYEAEADDDEADEDAQEAAALAWLENRTTVVTFDGGIIVGSF